MLRRHVFKQEQGAEALAATTRSEQVEELREGCLALPGAAMPSERALRRLLAPAPSPPGPAAALGLNKSPLGTQGNARDLGGLAGASRIWKDGVLLALWLPFIRPLVGRSGS